MDTKKDLWKWFNGWSLTLILPSFDSFSVRFRWSIWSVIHHVELYLSFRMSMVKSRLSIVWHLIFVWSKTKFFFIHWENLFIESYSSKDAVCGIAWNPIETNRFTCSTMAVRLIDSIGKKTHFLHWFQGEYAHVDVSEYLSKPRSSSFLLFLEHLP